MCGGIQVEAKGDLLIVSEPTSNFVAIYVKPSGRPRLILMRRTPTTDNVLLAHAFQAAVKKARELQVDRVTGGSDDPPQINSRPCMALLSKLPILARAQRRVRGAQLKARER